MASGRRVVAGAERARRHSPRLTGLMNHQRPSPQAETPTLDPAGHSRRIHSGRALGLFSKSLAAYRYSQVILTIVPRLLPIPGPVHLPLFFWLAKFNL
jgi:hypothetical protein